MEQCMMRESKQTISRLLSAFADALDSMDDREFDLLIQGKVRLRIVEKHKTKTAPPLNDSRLDGAISEIAQRLSTAESRESAASLLASVNQPRRRDFLLLLAKSCGVRVESKDNIARIEQKLIENVVGSKLDSEAIRKVAF
jgi:hypothetical protein